MTTDLEKLLEMAKNRPVSVEEREAQRRSFAYGNTNIENEKVTRETINRAAERLAAEAVKSF